MLPGLRGRPRAAAFSLEWGTLCILICVSTVGAQGPASNSYFSEDTPADGLVFYYTPGDTFVFPPPGVVVEVHDPDSNGTAGGSIQPIDFGEDGAVNLLGVPELANWNRGPIASITRGAFIGNPGFYPGRPNSFRPSTNQADDPHQLEKEKWFCAEWGAYLSTREPDASAGCSAANVPFSPSDVSFTNLLDSMGAIQSNKTRFTYSFTMDASVSAELQVPNAHRTICIQAQTFGGLNPDLNNDHIRCWHIVFDIVPKAAECDANAVDVLTCGKKQLPLVLRNSIDMGAVQPIPSVQQIVRVAVGQTLKANVYFEDLNRDNTVNCTLCDDVSINVLSDPGLPNGATMNVTKGRNDIDFSADAPSRLVRYKDDSFDSTRAYYVFSRELTFTPTLADARMVNTHGQPGNGVLYQVCFQATSQQRGSPLASSIITSQVYCGFIQVIVPRPTMLDAVQQRPPTAMLMELPFYDMMNPSHFYTAATSLPYEVTVRCPYEWVIRTQDTQNLPATFASDMVAGYEQGHYNTVAMPHTASPLPMGATISPSGLDMDDFVQDQVLAWTPQRGMEGHTFSFCVTVADARIRTNSVAACTRVVVKKCEVCAEAGDTLHSVALDYRTDWLQLWGANPTVPAPNLLDQYNVLNLGPMLTTNRNEAMGVLAARFSMSVDDLAAVNPDLGGDQDVMAGTDVCLVPRICEGVGEGMM